MMTLFRPSSQWVEIDSEGALSFITNVIETRLVLYASLYNEVHESAIFDRCAQHFSLVNRKHCVGV